MLRVVPVLELVASAWGDAVVDLCVRTSELLQKVAVHELGEGVSDRFRSLVEQPPFDDTLLRILGIGMVPQIGEDFRGQWRFEHDGDTGHQTPSKHEGFQRAPGVSGNSSSGNRVFLPTSGKRIELGPIRTL